MNTKLLSTGSSMAAFVLLPLLAPTHASAMNDVATGRWMTRDPLGYKSGLADAIELDLQSGPIRIDDRILPQSFQCGAHGHGNGTSGCNSIADIQFNHFGCQQSTYDDGVQSYECSKLAVYEAFGSAPSRYADPSGCSSIDTCYDNAQLCVQIIDSALLACQDSCRQNFGFGSPAQNTCFSMCSAGARVGWTFCLQIQQACYWTKNHLKPLKRLLQPDASPAPEGLIR